MKPASSPPLPPEDLLAHAGFVRGLARALVSGDADVDDVVQETWVAALGSQGRNIRKPRSWLASIVRRRAARHHRTRASMDKRHAEGARSVEVPTPDDLAARHETIQKVSAALAALPANYRDVLVLRYYEELPPREVAKRLEIPVETARTRIRRGLVRLREILDERHDGRRAAWAMPLAGLVPSGGAGAGIGTVVVGGLAVAAVLVLGFALAPWPWGEKAPPPIEQAEHEPDEVSPPVLMGRGEPGPDTLDVSDSTSPSEAVVEAPARIDEEAPPADDAADKVEVLVRVADEKGQPVEGLTICEHIQGAGGRPNLTPRSLGRTDASGRAVVLASASAVRIGIERNDDWHIDGIGPAAPAPGEEVVITVLPCIVVKGTVLDASGTPVEGAQPIARFSLRSSRGSSSMAFSQCGPTDENGFFTVPLPSYTREVTFDVYGADATASVRLDLTQPQRDVVIRMQPRVWIHGEVVTEDGTPLVESIPRTQQVSAKPVAGGLAINALLTKDRSGTFAIMVPRPDLYCISVTWTPRNMWALGTPSPVIVKAPAKGVRLVCPSGHRLAGQVRGTDVERFGVRWVRRTGDGPLLRVDHGTSTDAEGRFVLNGLAEGDTILYVHRSGDERYGLLEHVRLSDEGIDIELRRGRTIRGRVRGYSGRHGFGLWLHFAWRGPSISVEVGDDGTFAVTGFPPGTYGVRWQRRGKHGDLDLEVEAGTEEVEVILPEEVLRMGQTPEK